MIHLGHILFLLLLPVAAAQTTPGERSSLPAFYPGTSAQLQGTWDPPPRRGLPLCLWPKHSPRTQSLSCLPVPAPTLQALVPDVGPSLCRSWQASWLLMRWHRCSSWGRCSCAHAHAAAPPKKMAKSTSTCQAGADPPAAWTFDF
ncbi:hematopoietic cell signal transducer isoform X1 [Homo sapiens]|uniref:hematopoietic cell signal transducer isoform X1 n=1 Tax=Homo sapiens TaxID=9606 RepID=UPI0007DC802B|nr:hematopoietic cell signal transducer isoform X1 [Homo sapiens]XP_054175569.1 hematopoietic cell signal transducer isoform X1 [Homo sapiens]|eukprot:XP_016881682.1 hematopoietic cell signal transducer isoform X1 [Homo sapiens]